MTTNPHPREGDKKCDIDDCPEVSVAVEKLTGTDMHLCIHHFKHYFGKIFENAEIVDMTGEEND